MAHVLSPDMLVVNEGKAEFWLTIGALSNVIFYFRAIPPFLGDRNPDAFWMGFEPGLPVNLYHNQGAAFIHVGDFLELCPWGGWEGWRVTWKVDCLDALQTTLAVALFHYDPTYIDPWVYSSTLYQVPLTPMFLQHASIAFQPTGENAFIDDVILQRYDNPKWNPPE
jgi:hypothetical protein